MKPVIQLVVLVVLGLLFGLSALSRRYPHIGWLQTFHIKWPQLSEQQKALMERRANIRAGIQFILLGFGVPVGYVVSCVMMFNDPTTLGLTISALIGFAVIVLGVIAIRSNRRRPRPPHRELEFYERVTGRPWEDRPGPD